MNSNSPALKSDRILQDVSWHISRLLPAQPSLATVAAKLNLSNRTLQRLLQQQHTRFRDLVAHCRHQRALQLLAGSALSLQQIAAALGFEEQSSFQKAFKHWQGCSPGAYRQQQPYAPHWLQHKTAPAVQQQVNYGIN